MWNFIVPLAMAAISAKAGADDRAAKQQYNNAMADASKYNYLTGANYGPGGPITGSMLGDAAGGAVQGMALTQQFGGESPTPATGDTSGSGIADFSNPFSDPNYQTGSRYGLLGRNNGSSSFRR